MRKLPDNEKVKHGTDQPSRMTGTAVQWETLEEIPGCPEWFNSDQRKCWMDLCEQLLAAGILCVPYLPIVEGYCCSYDTWLQASKGLKEEGVYQVIEYMNGTKKVVPNPLTKVQSAAMASMLSYAGRLGMTPKDQGSIHGSQANEDKGSLLK